MVLRGLEVHYSAIKNKLQSREDCLFLALHVVLLNHDIICVGTGDEWPEEGHSHPSELLPEEWNSNQEVYTLRYVSNSSIRYVVKAVVIPNCLLVNVLNINEEKVAYISMNIDNYVAEEFGDFLGTYKNLDELCKTVENEVFKKMDDTSIDSEKKPIKEKEEKTEDDDPVIIDELLPRFVPETSPYVIPNIGHGDLNPFGGCQGGGMLLQPSRRPQTNMPGFDDHDSFGLPRGAVPPGARFDHYDPAAFLRQNPPW